MQRTKPPFRADHVGSLLRPAALKEAREKRAKGEIGDAELKAVEDRAIEDVIKKQEAAGLQSITDGEFRRLFDAALDLVAAFQPPGFAGDETKYDSLVLGHEAQRLETAGALGVVFHEVAVHVDLIEQ